MTLNKATLLRRWAGAMLIAGTAACGHPQPPVARPAPPPPPPPATSGTRPPEPPSPVPEPVMPAEPIPGDSVASRSLDDLNRDSPLRPVYFDFDSSDLNDAGRAVLQNDAAVMKKYSTWVVTIEGHCDERGTKEYNLALGERRAVAARAYLLSLGLDASRLRTVTYGSEFPFDPGHNESAWQKNRRAYFVITAK
jgi:peptidoglycan-associated lipoprotein